MDKPVGRVPLLASYRDAEPDEPLGTRIGSEEKIVSAAGIFHEPEILKKDNAAAKSIQYHKEVPQHKPQDYKNDVHILQLCKLPLCVEALFQT